MTSRSPDRRSLEGLKSDDLETAKPHKGLTPESVKKRVYLVDGHVMLRQGLSVLINATPGLVICGETGSAEEALQEIPDCKPDIAILELALDGKSGLDLIKTLHARHPELTMLVLSMREESFFAERALRAGAYGYVMKHQAFGELEKAIRRILEGGIYLSPEMSDRLLKVMIRADGSPRGAGIDLLSDREVEVFEMIGSGFGNTEIARRLYLSIKTIETHRARIKQKLDLHTAGELFQYAMAWVQGTARGGSGTSP